MNAITIEVDKQKLLTTLKDNRAKHREVVEDAWIGYLEQAEKQLEEQIERARKGLRQQFAFRLVVPADHTEDYDRVISMLEMDISDTVELEEDDFARYVQDQWEWRRQWTTTNANYTAMIQ